MSIRYVIGIDPSGNYIEGKGTTGIAVYDIKFDRFVTAGCVSATDYKSQIDYWEGVVQAIKSLLKQYGKQNCALAVESYMLYANKAASQINSEFETPQIIGVIKYEFRKKCPILFRPAVVAKKRWTDAILMNKKYIHVSGRCCYILDENNEPIKLLDHSRDAMRHAVYCGKFEIKDGAVCKK